MDAHGEEARSRSSVRARGVHIMRRNCFLLVLATCLLSVAVVPRQSSAKDCGGDVQCECGDTVQGRATLGADLGVCKETGLFVANGSLLDCDHHTITGRGQEAGVLFDSTNGAEVHNCSITKFQIGVRVKGGQGNAIVGNEILGHQKYGIDLADAAAGVRSRPIPFETAATRVFMLVPERVTTPSSATSSSTARPRTCICSRPAARA